MYIFSSNQDNIECELSVGKNQNQVGTDIQLYA